MLCKGDLIWAGILVAIMCTLCGGYLLYTVTVVGHTNIR